MSRFMATLDHRRQVLKKSRMSEETSTNAASGVERGRRFEEMG